MIELIVSDEQDKLEITQEMLDNIKKVIELCEIEEGINFENEISLTFTDNENIRQINLQYRNIDKETDVLSFPMYDVHELEKEKKSADKRIKPLGDIVISLEKTLEQSQEFGHCFERELCYLVCHSMFHLTGYDHIEEDDRKIMREKEEKIMNMIGLKR